MSSKKIRIIISGVVAIAVAFLIYSTTDTLKKSLFTDVTQSYNFKSNNISSTFALCSSCTIMDAGTSTSYNLNSGQKLCITSGTYTGTINNFNVNAEICVWPDAKFNPSTVNNWSGKLYNYGIVNLYGLNLSNGAVINNYATLNLNGNVNFNGSTTWFNADSANMSIQSVFIFSNGSSFINEGVISALDNFNTTSNTSFHQKNRINIIGSFNPDGVFTNDGSVVAYSFININNNSTVVNNCRFISRSGFNNNSSRTQNNGLIWVTGETGDLIQNNQTMYMGPGSWLRGIRFYNNAAITGIGQMYFTGETRNQAAFGNDGLGINFYDATPVTGLTFDVEGIIPHSSVTKKANIPQDTGLFVRGGSCATTLLETNKTNFKVVVANKKANLTWSIPNNGIIKSVVERSYTGKEYSIIKEILSTNELQKYTDEIIISGNYFYRIRFINGNGSFILSNVVSINTQSDKLIVENLSPNPVRDILNLNINLANASTIIVKIINLQGIVVATKTMQGVAGVNNITINNLNKLTAGMYIVQTKSGNLVSQIKIIK